MSKPSTSSIAIAIAVAGLVPVAVIAMGPEWALVVGGRFSPALAERLAFRVAAYAALLAIPAATLWLACVGFRWRLAARACGTAAVGAAAIASGGVLGVAALFGLTLRADAERYAPVLVHATEYSPSYSEQAFRSVASGWAEDHLCRVLGDPLDEFAVGDHVIHVYSRIGEYQSIVDKGFHQRLVITRRGVVQDVIRRYRTAEHAPFAKLTEEVDHFLVPE